MGNVSFSGDDEDILTQALDSKEHNGRVRGVGKFITPTSYFHTPNLRADWERDKKVWEKEKKEWEKQKMDYDRRLVDLEAKLLGRVNDQQSPAARFESHSSNFTPTMFFEGQMKGSHSITTKNKVEHTLCKLAVDSIDNIVANGTILEHNVAEVLVSIDVVLNEDALLPIPSEDYELFCVKDALGHHINWPKELVVEDSVIAICKFLIEVRKKVEETEKVKRPKFSLGIENFAKKAWRVIVPGDVVRVNFDEGIFSLEHYCFFGMEEVTTMINMKELQQTNICLYMRDFCLGVLDDELLKVRDGGGDGDGDVREARWVDGDRTMDFFELLKRERKAEVVGESDGSGFQVSNRV
ncbi:hypothetical protein Q3G72_020798 [Acer saccharum]|nr:hypothetical protein Q3G72_020798 [Acer saccharum]